MDAREHPADEGQTTVKPAVSRAAGDDIDDPRYRDPRTNNIAHTIDNYVGLLRNTYYPGFDVMIAETGWHTAGTCGAYNDCSATYSPRDAADYYADLYAYVQKNKVPLLAFQLFDERTKQCDLAPGASGEMAEANYGLFSNVCQLKDPTLAPLPPAGPGSPGPNLVAFNALLDSDGAGGKSCAGQTLLQTASGVRPSVSVEIKVRDARRHSMDFSITVDHDSMPTEPSACAGHPSQTQLRTNFIIDDGAGQPLSIDTILPWRCHGKELRLHGLER